MFIGAKVLEKNDPNNTTIMMFSTLVDSNTILSKEALNNEKDKHCERLEQYLMNGLEYISKLIKH